MKRFLSMLTVIALLASTISVGFAQEIIPQNSGTNELIEEMYEASELSQEDVVSYESAGGVEDVTSTITVPLGDDEDVSNNTEGDNNERILSDELPSGLLGNGKDDSTEADQETASNSFDIAVNNNVQSIQPPLYSSQSDSLLASVPIVSYSGSFTQSNYALTVGDSLNVGITANATNANLTRVTINVDASGYDRLASTEISGTSWSGSLTLDGTTAPLNVPGTYTIKLYVAGDAGDA